MILSHPGSLKVFIEKDLAIAENNNTLWASIDFNDKRNLLSLVLPKGIVYRKQKGRIRTLGANSLFAEIPDLAGDPSENKNGHS